MGSETAFSQPGQCVTGEKQNYQNKGKALPDTPAGLYSATKFQDTEADRVAAGSFVTQEYYFYTQVTVTLEEHGCSLLSGHTFLPVNKHHQTARVPMRKL